MKTEEIEKAQWSNQKTLWDLAVGIEKRTQQKYRQHKQTILHERWTDIET